MPLATQVRAILRASALFAVLAAVPAPSAAAQDSNGAVYESGEVCVEIDCRRRQVANRCGRPVNFAVCHADASGGCLMNFFDSLETGQSKVFSCKEGKSGNIAACNKPFKPVSISPFEFRCVPDPADPDIAQKSAKQAEVAKSAQAAPPAPQSDNPANCLVVQRDSQIVGTDFNGQPIDVGSNLLANNCNCDMNVTMSPENFVVPANQRVVVPTPGSAIYSYFACFAPQKPVFVGNGKYECRGGNPQSECRVTGNFVETREAAPAAQPRESAATQSDQPDDSCQYANDGVCDEPSLCSTGTDTADCASRRGEEVAEARDANNQPDDSCQYANDGECDEPNTCPTGTDATDCASRSGEEVAKAREADIHLDDSCQYANDGECDEPNTCPTGTDATDCASRRAEEAVRRREAEERRLAEELQLAAEAEERRLAEERQLAAEAEERRLAEERQLAAEADAKEANQQRWATLRRRQAEAQEEAEWQRQRAEETARQQQQERVRRQQQQEARQQQVEQWRQAEAETQRQREQADETQRRRTEAETQRRQAAVASANANNRRNQIESQQRTARNRLTGRHNRERELLAGVTSSTEKIERTRRRQDEEWAALIERQRGELDNFSRQYGQDAGALRERLSSAGRAYQQGFDDDFRNMARAAEQRQRENARRLEEEAEKARALAENYRDPHRCASLRAVVSQAGGSPYQDLQSTNTCVQSVWVVYRTQGAGFSRLFVSGRSTENHRVHTKRHFWDGSQKCVEYLNVDRNSIVERFLSTAKCPK